MDDDSTPLPTPPLLSGPRHHLLRRNSISTSVLLPTMLTHLSSSSSSSSPTTKPRYSCSFPTQNGGASTPRPPQLDLDLLSLKSSESYTSLKDLLPSSSFAAVQSPTPNSASNSSYEISIRNRLVKQAAWAYLQPMSSTCGPSGPHLLRRLWLKCLSFLRRFLHCFQLC